MFSRRHFLKASSAAGLSALSLGHMRSLAADRSGYKAMVCVFFFGGQDHDDTVIPYDQPSYNSWRAARQVLIDQFNDPEAPFRFSRDRANLLPLSPLNAGQ
ncbi:MAG: twin-arginine translocation signal domain-containing protein, partial [Pseudomonadota bacterium]